MSLNTLNKLTQVSILVIGDVMLDRYIWGVVERISPEAPVPVVHVREITYNLGGAGNVANNLKGLGSKPILVGTIGDDHRGQLLLDLLKQRGIKSYLLKDNTRPTVTKTRIMAQQQQLLRIDEEKTDELHGEIRNKLFEICKKYLPECRAVILSDYGKGVLKGDLCKKIISLARSISIPVFIDPKGTDWERYEGASCITPNEKEFCLFIGQVIEKEKEYIQKAKQTIEKLNLESLLITRGAKGMILVEKDGNVHNIKAQAKEVFDVSGAGDTVIATLSACIAAGADWLKAAELANIAAGIVVGKVGTKPIEKEEIEIALKQ